MKKFTTFFARTAMGVVAIFMAAIFSAIPAQAQDQSASLTVKVADESGFPLAGANVTFDGETLVTLGDGTVSFTGLAATAVSGRENAVEVYKDGYEPYVGSLPVTDALDVDLDVVLKASEATFTVKVISGEEPVEGATVTFKGQELLTPENGEVKFTGINAPEVLGSVVAYTVYKDGYEPFEGGADFTEGFEAYAVANIEASAATLTVKVISGEEPVEGATVTFKGQELLTPENGEVKFTDISAPEVLGTAVAYTVYKDGYEPFEGSADFTEGFEAYSIAALEASAATLTVKVMAGEEPVEGATVTFKGQELVTPENGEVKFTDISAPEVLGTAVAYTVYKDGYEPFEGSADFTEGFEAYSIAELVAAEAQVEVKAIYGEGVVAGAMVTFQGKDYTTDDEGSLTISLEGPAVIGQTFPISIYKDGFEPFEGTADFTESLTAYVIADLVAAEAQVIVKAISGDDVVEGAVVYFEGEEYITDETGSVTISLQGPAVIGQTLPITVYKDGYEAYEGTADFTESLTAYVVADLVAAEAQLIVKAISGDDVVDGATVTFEGQEYTTDETGSVTISLEGPAVIGKTFAITVAKEGYETYEGTADFTEGLTAYVIAVLEQIPSGIGSIYLDPEDTDLKVYDLQGRRVTNPRSGQIYIVNGRKVLLNL